MDKEEQEARQAFFDEIASYQYFRKDGRLILEPFGVYLSHCFGFDGILELSPKPWEVYDLLISIISEYLGEGELREKVQFQKISDWSPGMEYIFPKKEMTCIHPAALMHVSHFWIYEIGHTLMGYSNPNGDRKYFAWAKEEWLAVHTFINGYHNALSVLLKESDRKSISSNGYSNFEALHFSRLKNIGYDEAANLLKARHNVYQEALSQISKAIQSGFYLEAIVLQENLISNCLFNFLDAVGVSRSKPSFNDLLNVIGDKKDLAYEFPKELFNSLNTWRKARNHAIHNFITAQTMNLAKSQSDFQQISKKTAMQGEEYCKSVVEWYELESINFIRHEFPRKYEPIVH